MTKQEFTYLYLLKEIFPGNLVITQAVSQKNISIILLPLSTVHDS